MNIAICDDDKEYMEDIEKHIKLYFSDNGLKCNIFKYCTSNDILNSKIKFDIAFLDIEIDETNGIEIGRRLKEAYPQMVLIIITAYNHYLDDAIDIGITRYFEKPFNTERFYEGLNCAISKVDTTDVIIFCDDGNQGHIRVLCKDIIYLEIVGRKTKIVTTDATYYSKESIDAWRDKLNKTYFDYPHKSFIINTNYVTYYCRDHVILNRKYNVPIAYNKRSEFKRKFLLIMEG